MDFLNFIVENPVISFFIAVFIIICVSKFHIVENNTYNFYENKECGNESEEDEIKPYRRGDFQDWGVS